MTTKQNSIKAAPKKDRDIEEEMIQSIRRGGFDRETTESRIGEIKEICDFEDGLEEF